MLPETLYAHRDGPRGARSAETPVSANRCRVLYHQDYNFVKKFHKSRSLKPDAQADDQISICGPEGLLAEIRKVVVDLPAIWWHKDESERVRIRNRSERRGFEIESSGMPGVRTALNLPADTDLASIDSLMSGLNWILETRRFVDDFTTVVTDVLSIPSAANWTFSHKVREHGREGKRGTPATLLELSFVTIAIGDLLTRVRTNLPISTAVATYLDR